MSAGGNPSVSGAVRQQRPQPSSANVHYPFWFGGSAACWAATVTHPLDLVKVRMQTRGPGDPSGMLGTFAHIVRNEGLRGMYNGLSASLLRQMTYSTTRFGVYGELKTYLGSKNSTPNSPVFLISIACVSGFAGGVVGNPADIINVRMQRDKALPLVERRGYRNAFDGLIRLVRDEGVHSLFRGVWPNSVRALLMTASQLASYDTFKQALRKHLGMGDTLVTHFSASFLSGFVATTICSPADVIKTRVMSANPADGGHKKGIMVFIKEIFQKEGFRWMFRGWIPSFMRLGPHTIATFLFLEQHKKLYRALYLND